jgi:hypothetical protein
MRLDIWVVWKKAISFSSLRRTLKWPVPSVIWCEFLRQEILERRNARRQRRQDMAKRRTAAAQERMRLISQLARKEKRDDNFGMRDEDWDVYKAINKVLITRCTYRPGEMSTVHFNSRHTFSTTTSSNLYLTVSTSWSFCSKKYCCSYFLNQYNSSQAVYLTNCNQIFHAYLLTSSSVSLRSILKIVFFVQKNTLCYTPQWLQKL